MPSSTNPMTSTIVLPPITAFDYPSREAPVPPPFRQSPYDYLPYPPHLPSTSLPDPRTSYHQTLENFQPTSQTWPGSATFVPQPARVLSSVSADPTYFLAPQTDRSNFKEVKRRTKTGCQTCRKRRIKCDEARPACRNCIKSKRVCLGYEPGLQAQSSNSSLQIVPRSHPGDYQTLPPATTQSEPYIFHRAPSVSSRTSSLAADSPLSRTEYLRSSEAVLPPILSRSPEAMEQHTSVGEGDYRGRSHISYLNQNIRRAKRCTIDELCTIDGTQRPNLPPLPSDPPNLDAIKTIFDTAFAPGLDKLLETTWFSTSAFQYLVNDRAFLSQILAYITLIHNHTQGLGNGAALASQEARISWALLGLCVRPQPPTPHLRCLKGRLHAISVMLTADGVPPDGVIVQEEEDGDAIRGDETALQRQQRRREHEFWRGVGKVVSLSWNYAAKSQRSREELDMMDHEVELALRECRCRLDGREGRDVVFSILSMRRLGEKWGEVDGDGTDDGDVHMDGKEKEMEEAVEEWNEARRFLEEEASGRSSALVLNVIAGMAGRVWLN